MVKTTLPKTSSATVGLDVGDRFTSFCVIDALGDVAEEGKIRTCEEQLLERLRPFKGARFVLEVGVHSPWITRLLQKEGMKVIVANPRKVELIRQNYRKTDRGDAEILARVGRLDPVLLSPVEHRSEQQQADLAVIRSRAALVAARTMLINQVRGSVKSFGGTLPRCDAHSFHKHAPAHLPPSLAVALSPLIAAIAATTSQIFAMDARVKELIETRYPAAIFVQQVHGVGPITSLTFVLTLADPTRFPKSREVGPFLGLTPRLRQSGDSSPQLRITKAGDTLLRSLLVQCAHYILGPFGEDSDLRRWGRERLERGGKNGKKRVYVAVARKLAVLLHRLWATGEVYDPFYRSGGALAPASA